PQARSRRIVFLGEDGSRQGLETGRRRRCVNALGHAVSAMTARKSEGFFGRRHGKALRARQAESLAVLLPRYAIDLDTPPPAQLETLFPGPVDKVCIEIGFGGG